MKPVILSSAICSVFIALLSYSGHAKGSCSGHGHYVAHSSYTSHYRGLNTLRDSSFPGYVVLRHDTLRGTLSRFGSSDLRLVASDGHRKNIYYSSIDVLHLDEASGQLHLCKCPGHSGFFRLLVAHDDLALYDQKMKPHASLSDVDTGNLLFRYKDFSRDLSADFHKGLRKKIVPIINARYAVAITPNTSKKEVYRIMSGGGN